MHERDHCYHGFEQGPIRPPSEAASLLVRVTRSCPWNKCTFCPVYKGARFSVRPVAHVKRDIDAVHRHVERLRNVRRHEVGDVAKAVEPDAQPAFAAAYQWCFVGGLKSVFIQDANSLIIKTAELVEILNHLTMRFPAVKRITSYARSHTLARRTAEELQALRDAGLNRIHVGLESGSDEILKRVRKGVTKEMHIQAGRKVKKAGIELSEYFMPGLGGRALSEENALESADALNRIDPDFIRIRTLAISAHSPLFEDFQAGRFEKCTDVMVAEELLAFIEKLDGISSVVKSDHILNLFGDLEGTLPRDKERMSDILRTFLAMDPERRTRYQVGRRLGVFSQIRDMDDPEKMAMVETRCRELGVTPENVDALTDEVMRMFI
ncbi:MAG: radical SAM protein [bacterium]|nr:radical SAM protein [bacterium]